MLNNKLRKAGAVIPAAAILFTSMSFPAAAKTAVNVTKPVTTTVISDNFNGYTAAVYNNMTATPTDFAQNSAIQYSNYNTSGGYPGARVVTVAEREDDASNKYMKLDTWVGLNLNFNPAEPISVLPGDVVTVKFKYNYYNTQNQQIHVNLNNADTRYQGKEGGSNDGGMWWTSGSKDYKTNQGRIACINKTSMSVSDNTFGAISAPAQTWNDVTITINTRDSEYSDKQTLTVATGSSYLKGLFDANSTGEGDTEFDVLSQIASIQFLSYKMGGANDGDYFAIDDLTVTVAGDRDIVEYESELDTTLLNESFSNVSSDYSRTCYFSNDQKAIPGTSLMTTGYGSGGKITTGYPDESASENAVKLTDTATGDTFPAIFFNTDKAVSSGDIINMSFDYYQTSQNISLSVALQNDSKTIGYRQIQASNWYGLDKATKLADHWYAPATYLGEAPTTKTLTKSILAASKSENAGIGVLAPIRGHSGSNPAVQTFGTNTWYTIEISIDTKNEAYGGKQTMSFGYKNRATGEYVQKYLGYLDTDASTVGDDYIDAIKQFKGFTVCLRGTNLTFDAYIDNVKCSIQRPAFELWGNAADGHETDGKFTAGEMMFVKAGADPALIGDRSVNMMLVAALYDSEDRFIGAQLVEKVLSASNTYIQTEEFSTEGVAKVKTFLWEKETLTPNLMFGTFTAGTAAN